MAENFAPECSHSRDFRSVVWYGTEYRFSPQQAACVQVLWRAWLSGTPIIRDEQVLDTAGVKARSLKDVFRTRPGLPAWGAMIGNGDRRGTVRLQEGPATANQGDGSPAGLVDPSPMIDTARARH